MFFFKEKIILFTTLLLVAAGGGVTAHAASLSDSQRQISTWTSEIKKVEEEIAALRSELQELGTQAKTLNSEIRRIELTERALEADQRVTEQRIQRTEATIEKLNEEIVRSEESIGENSGVLARSLRRLYEIESRSLAEIILAKPSFSSFWESASQLSRFQSSVYAHIGELQEEKQDLTDKRTARSKEREQLVALTNRLKAQKAIAAQNRRDKEGLLKQTENKEENYQAQLKEREERKELLESELRAFEQQLRTEIDPNALPPSGSTVLRFPLAGGSTESCYDGGAGSKNCATQYFGNTEFATKNPQIYSGAGHNGIDFRAGIGEQVRAAASGIVRETGNTDKIQAGSDVRVSYTRLNVRESPNGSISGTQYSGRTGIVMSGPVIAGDYQWWNVDFDQGVDGWVADMAINNQCYSYGKWVLVDHYNGLSTLYAHLSHIIVNEGDEVSIGNPVGYSGNTGYSTGPHLHFTVYATKGVRIVRLGDIKEITNCGAARIPVASFNAYLNPLSYLPQ